MNNDEIFEELERTNAQLIETIQNMEKTRDAVRDRQRATIAKLRKELQSAQGQYAGLSRYADRRVAEVETLESVVKVLANALAKGKA